MNYSEMSDFEINCAVAYHIGLSTVISAESLEFKPCNSWADAGPIIQDNCISLVWDCSEDASHSWWNAIDQFDGCTIQFQVNPLRAAMIVFLMMKEL